VTDNQSATLRNHDETGFQILIIDDNEHLCRALAKLIRRMGMAASYETTLQLGLQAAVANSYDVIFLDVNLPDGCGLDIIPKLREGNFPPEIIIITGYGDMEGAETAIKNQAWDYIPKDTSFQNLKLSLARAVQYRKQKKAIAPRAFLHRNGIIGKSPPIVACLEQVAQAAGNDSPVLILGETGAGKEVFARSIHKNSPRAAGDFVVVDCSALPEYLVESTLFGHMKGAFTGADSDRVGLVKQAHSGTLFLDEIGELSGDIQKKFLRVLQEKRFRPVGGKTEVESDFRLVCATHRDLPRMVEDGAFRRDLYYRIRSIVIVLPRLSDRPGDIPDLAIYQMKRNCRLSGGEPHRMSPDFLEALQAYEWPGNVRELFNVIDCVHSETPQEPELFPMHLPIHIRTHAARRKIKISEKTTLPPPLSAAPTKEPDVIPLNAFLEEMRHQYIKNLMAMTRGNVPDACRISKLSRGHLYNLLKKYNWNT
jgi:two-component system, NtrC family, response regulator